jgi:hypothetical protein
MLQRRTHVWFYLSVFAVWGCAESTTPSARRQDEGEPATQPPPRISPAVLEPQALQQPVPLWENATATGVIDAATASSSGHVVIDLGEAWTPYLFTEGTTVDGQALVNSYRDTFLRLARGDFPDDYHGKRAREDKYLELYGIMPTLRLLRDRMHAVAQLECVETLDLAPLDELERVSLETSASSSAPRNERRGPASQRLVRRAVQAAQRRLRCEGFLPAAARDAPGVLDANTRKALMEFERRHRIYGWGNLSGETLAMLRVAPREAELRSVVRVVTERAVHAAGVIEDGSTQLLADGSPRTFVGLNGKQPVPNLIAELQQRVVSAFGLQTPESALAWLDSLGDLPADEHHFAAFRGPTQPEYYSSGMDLRVQIDRGDVWYDFPYDEHGRKLPQPVERRPELTVSVRYMGQSIPLARYGTTIGGWRSKQFGDAMMWKYQESPVGKRVWSEIVAAPVWMPPDTTPIKALLKPKPNAKASEAPYEVNYYTTGPGYASAFGLVAAYHNRFVERRGGAIEVGYDEGIRTHGSVDYMSIMRRESNGCHRMHNHIALRLMSWLLAHRPHVRKGQEPLAFKRTLEYEAQLYPLQLDHGGYVFELDPPLEVEVLEGRIRGRLDAPIAFEIPKFDEAAGAYLTAEGKAVALRGRELVEVGLPSPAPGQANAADVAPSELINTVEYRPSAPGPSFDPSLLAKPKS